jgi:hypothetical protein
MSDRCHKSALQLLRSQALHLDLPPTFSHTATPLGWCTLPRVRPTTYAPFPSTASPGFLTDRRLRIQHAVELAKESFVELRDVERERISLEVHVVLKNQQVRRTAEIGRTAWPVVVASLARFEIVEIRVASEPKALSSAQASSVSPPPYVSEKGWHPDYSQSNLTPYRSQMSSSQSSFATRVVDLLTPKSSRGRLSPQPYQL